MRGRLTTIMLQINRGPGSYHRASVITLGRMVGVVMFGVVLFSVISCKPPTPAATLSTNAASAGPAGSTLDPAAALFDRPARRVSLEFSVHRISAPRGRFTEDSTIWKLVTHPLASEAMTLQLASNGIRAGIGLESDRAALITELSKFADIRIAMDHVQPDAHRALELELGACAPRQSIFYYDSSGAIHGGDFVNARARLKVAFEMRVTNLNEVWLELVPEVEEPPGPKKWVRMPDGAYREIEEERRTTFEELTFSARVPEGGFLLVGPTSAVHEQPLLARVLFVETLENTRNPEEEFRESIYVISPIIRAAEERRSGPSTSAISGD
jgi:hypothetical protein